MNIDLHIHSSFSDGAYAPLELVTMAKRLELGAIAIADHDSVGGVSDGITCGTTLQVEVIPAVELSVQYGGWNEVHLLGYGIDYCDQIFLERLNAFRERREVRNDEILELVNKLLVHEGHAPVGIAEVLTFARDSIGRPHIARALLERGYVENIEDAFRRYLTACDVPKSYWPIEDAIQEILRIGGVPVLAHPTSISRNHGELRNIIIDLISLGLEGIEVFNNMVYPEDMEFLRRLAVEQRSLVTAGSDFHGVEGGVEMGKGRGGIRFSDSLVTPLKFLKMRRAG